MTKSVETLINGEGAVLNLHNNPTLFTVLFLAASHNWPPLTPNIFLLSLAREDILSGDLGLVRRLLNFPGSLPGIHGVYMLLNFCLFFLWLICLLLQGWGVSAKNLEA